ncbi:YicC/YloC family endoribonuclease [Aureimonas jatrophae]|uniref:TIGR00255 family protein n=1 Tax=Aureimonas jatrophae TaxID=1166073 RepID=A0A1H0G9M8_9HYPH|nr:YicC/YloC family endoribonuclease [Aureimonas jatrophae]SDO03469.1 TIGR00255 family protein [Aureimonas jatrophae]
MSLRSMTGFARVERDGAPSGFVWELRSVNGKGLEIRLRLPPGFEELEADIRRLAAGALGRGNVQVSLAHRRDPGVEVPGFRVNEALLTDLLRLSDALVSEGRAAPPSADGLLALRGVIEVADAEPAAALSEQRDEILAAFQEALVALRRSRETEGRSLLAVLNVRLDRIEELTNQAEAHPARSIEAIRARLADQVALLRGAADGLDEARLHQEAALIATRADIREELDRLTAHVAAARELLSLDEPVGRRLDFLSQEFNREANTLCAKSNATALTAIGLDLKLSVDQFREQVQNIE